MADLDPRGIPVHEQDIVIASPGLQGTVTVHRPATGDTRSVDVGFEDTLMDRLLALGFDEQLTVEIAATPADVEPEEDRSTELGRPGLAVDVPAPREDEGQLCLLVDDDGATLSWHFRDASADSGLTDRAVGERRTYTIDAGVFDGADDHDGERGVFGTIGRKILKVLVFRLIDDVAGRVGDYFVQRWEQKRCPHRLRRFDASNYATQNVPSLDATDLATFGVGPALLFLHGTMSRSDAAFGRLPANVMALLERRYEGRMIAADHPTVSVDPAANARWLVEQTRGTDLEVDVIAHSRGGLVARELVERAGEIGLDPNDLRVRRIVFVATPNTGTALCNVKYLGALLDTLTNLIGLVPDNPVTDTLEIIASVVRQLAVGAFKGLDGLMAMNPEGAYLGRLNQGRTHGTAYAAVASNFEPGAADAVSRKLKDRFVDAIFGGHPNDLVVPTAGVYKENGASGFPIHDRIEFAADDAVDHSGFWIRAELHQALDRWLTG